MSRQEKRDVGKKHRLGGGGRLENHRSLSPSLGLGALQTWDTVCVRAPALWHRGGAAVGFLWKFSDLSVTLISSLWARESCIHWQYKQSREHTGEPFRMTLLQPRFWGPPDPQDCLPLAFPTCKPHSVSLLPALSGNKPFKFYFSKLASATEFIIWILASLPCHFSIWILKRALKAPLTWFHPPFKLSSCQTFWPSFCPMSGTRSILGLLPELNNSCLPFFLR